MYVELLNGESPIGFKYNQEAVEIFFLKINWEENTETAAVYATFWAGYKANCRVKGLEPAMNFEAMCDFVDTLTGEDIRKVCDCFSETQKYKDALLRIQNFLRTDLSPKKKKSKTR